MMIKRNNSTHTSMEIKERRQNIEVHRLSLSSVLVFASMLVDGSSLDSLDGCHSLMESMLEGSLMVLLLRSTETRATYKFPVVSSWENRLLIADTLSDRTRGSLQGLHGHGKGLKWVVLLLLDVDVPSSSIDGDGVGGMSSSERLRNQIIRDITEIALDTTGQKRTGVMKQLQNDWEAQAIRSTLEGCPRSGTAAICCYRVPAGSPWYETLWWLHEWRLDEHPQF